MEDCGSPLAGCLAVGVVLQPSNTVMIEPKIKAAADKCFARVPPVRGNGAVVAAKTLGVLCTVGVLLTAWRRPGDGFSPLHVDVTVGGFAQKHAAKIHVIRHLFKPCPGTRGPDLQPLRPPTRPGTLTHVQSAHGLGGGRRRREWMMWATAMRQCAL